MSIESDIYADLTSSTMITGYTSNRIYPVWLEQEVPYPCISYIRQGSAPVYAMSGHDTSLEHAFIEIDVFSTSYATTKTLRDNVLLVLDASTRLKAILQGDNDLFEDAINTDKKVYRNLMSFSIWGDN